MELSDLGVWREWVPEEETLMPFRREEGVGVVVHVWQERSGVVGGGVVVGVDREVRQHGQEAPKEVNIGCFVGSVVLMKFRGSLLRYKLLFIV
jgi:hypothetical protein